MKKILNISTLLFLLLIIPTNAEDIVLPDGYEEKAFERITSTYDCTARNTEVINKPMSHYSFHMCLGYFMQVNNILDNQEGLAAVLPIKNLMYKEYDPNSYEDRSTFFARLAINMDKKCGWNKDEYYENGESLDWVDSDHSAKYYGIGTNRAEDDRNSWGNNFQNINLDKYQSCARIIDDVVMQIQTTDFDKIFTDIDSEEKAKIQQAKLEEKIEQARIEEKNAKLEDEYLGIFYPFIGDGTESLTYSIICMNGDIEEPMQHCIDNNTYDFSIVQGDTEYTDRTGNFAFVDNYTFSSDVTLNLVEGMVVEINEKETDTLIYRQRVREGKIKKLDYLDIYNSIRISKYADCIKFCDEAFIKTANLENIKQLIIDGQSIDSVDKSGWNWSALLYVLRYSQDSDVVNYFIENTSNINLITSNDLSPLNYAIEYQNIELVEKLINHGADINQIIGSSEHTSLTKAVSVAIDPKIIDLLLQKGADIHYTDSSGWNVLYYISRNHSDYLNSNDKIIIIKKLIKLGLQTDILDNYGQNLIHALAFNNKTKENEIRALLDFYIELGLNPNAQNNYGKTPLHNAAGKRYMPSIRALTLAGVNINILDNDTNSPLLHSLWQSEEDVTSIVKFLLDNGADAKFIHKNKYTAYAMARINNVVEDPEIMNILLQNAREARKSRNYTISSWCTGEVFNNSSYKYMDFGDNGGVPAAVYRRVTDLAYKQAGIPHDKGDFICQNFEQIISGENIRAIANSNERNSTYMVFSLYDNGMYSYMDNVFAEEFNNPTY